LARSLSWIERRLRVRQDLEHEGGVVNAPRAVALNQVVIPQYLDQRAVCRDNRAPVQLLEAAHLEAEVGDVARRWVAGPGHLNRRRQRHASAFLSVDLQRE